MILFIVFVVFVVAGKFDRSSEEFFPFPSPEPYSLEWYYRLGDYSYDKSENDFNFTVEDCGTFVGYYQMKLKNSSNITNEIEYSCNFSREVLGEDRCNTTLIIAEYQSRIYNAKCKRTNESCSFEKICFTR